MTQIDWKPPFDVLIMIAGDDTLNLQVHGSSPDKIKEILKPLEEKGLDVHQTGVKGRFFSVNQVPFSEVERLAGAIVNALNGNNISVKCHDKRPKTTSEESVFCNPCGTEPTTEIEWTSETDVLVKRDGQNSLYVWVYGNKADETETVLKPLEDKGFYVDRILDNSFSIGRIYVDIEGLAKAIAKALEERGMRVQCRPELPDSYNSTINLSQKGYPEPLSLGLDKTKEEMLSMILKKQKSDD